MNDLYSLVGQAIGFGLMIYLMGLGISLICGGSPLAQRFTNWTLKTSWKITRRTFKTMIGLAADFFKWAHSKL